MSNGNVPSDGNAQNLLVTKNARLQTLSTPQVKVKVLSTGKVVADEITLNQISNTVAGSATLAGLRVNGSSRVAGMNISGILTFDQAPSVSGFVAAGTLNTGTISSPDNIEFLSPLNTTVLRTNSLDVSDVSSLLSANNIQTPSIGASGTTVAITDSTFEGTTTASSGVDFNGFNLTANAADCTNAITDSLVFTGSTPGTGQWLTSDADGKWQWTTPPSATPVEIVSGAGTVTMSGTSRIYVVQSMNGAITFQLPSIPVYPNTVKYIVTVGSIGIPASPSIASGNLDAVLAMDTGTDGRTFAGGAFQALSNRYGSLPVPNNNLTKFTPYDTIDTTFVLQSPLDTAFTSNTVLAIEYDEATSVVYVAPLDYPGQNWYKIDATGGFQIMNAFPDGAVYSMQLARNGTNRKLYSGGQFRYFGTAWYSDGIATSVSAVDATTGAIDTTWSILVAAESSVQALKLDEDNDGNGFLYVAGNFTSITVSGNLYGIPGILRVAVPIVADTTPDFTWANQGIDGDVGWTVHTVETSANYVFYAGKGITSVQGQTVGPGDIIRVNKSDGLWSSFSLNVYQASITKMLYDTDTDLLLVAYDASQTGVGETYGLAGYQSVSTLAPVQVPGLYFAGSPQFNRVFRLLARCRNSIARNLFYTGNGQQTTLFTITPWTLQSSGGTLIAPYGSTSVTQYQMPVTWEISNRSDGQWQVLTY